METNQALGLPGLDLPQRLFGGGPVAAIVGGYLGHKLDKYANDRQRYRENRFDAVECYIKEGYSVEEAFDLVNAQTK